MLRLSSALQLQQVWERSKATPPASPDGANYLDQNASSVIFEDDDEAFQVDRTASIVASIVAASETIQQQQEESPVPPPCPPPEVPPKPSIPGHQRPKSITKHSIKSIIIYKDEEEQVQEQENHNRFSTDSLDIDPQESLVLVGDTASVGTSSSSIMPPTPTSTTQVEAQAEAEELVPASSGILPFPPPATTASAPPTNLSEIIVKPASNAPSLDGRSSIGKNGLQRESSRLSLKRKGLTKKLKKAFSLHRLSSKKSPL